MRITTYKKGGNSLNPLIRLSFFLMIILCLFVMPVSADSSDVDIGVRVRSSVPDGNEGSYEKWGTSATFTKTYIEIPSEAIGYNVTLHMRSSGSTGSYYINSYSTSSFDENVVTWNNAPITIDLLSEWYGSVNTDQWFFVSIPYVTQYIVLTEPDTPHGLDMYSDDTSSNPYILWTASATSPEFDDVSWSHDPYYTGETANITTNILNFDAGTYSYYLDLYNTQEYLTTYEITNETESNYYTFPTEWVDTSLLAKLQRVTDPYGSNEVNLAMGLSHFETLAWDTTISFDKTSYNPSETLTVTWSGVPINSTIWLRGGNDGDKLEVNPSYSGSFQFIVPSNTEETYYLVDVITSGSSQAQSSCIINIGDYWTEDLIYIDSYTVNKTTFEGQTTSVIKDESAKATLTTNINVDFADVYYYNEEMGITITQDFIQNINDNVVNITFPNNNNGYYYARIDVFNISTTSDNTQYLFFDVGTGSRAIDIYNSKVSMDDTGEIITIESIVGYGGNDLYLPLARTILFDVYADEIINSTDYTIDNLIDGINYNFTNDYNLRRSYSFNTPGLHEIEITVYNVETSSDDLIKWNCYIQGVDQTGLNGSVVMYWTKSNIEVNDNVLLYFNVSDMPSTPILSITSTTESNYATERTLNINQVGTETVLTDEAGIYTAIITNAEGVVYAISTLTITDPGVVIDEVIQDTSLQDNTNNLLNSPYFIGIIIMLIFLAVGATKGIGGMIVTGSFGLGITCWVGIFPWVLLVIEVLVVAALMAKGMLDLSGE